jgi:hypothetical protein
MVYLLQQFASICTLGSLYVTGSAEVPDQVIVHIDIESEGVWL